MITEKPNPDGMKPERSEDIEIILDNWTVHAPYISQELEFSSFAKAVKFGEFVHEAAENWGAEVEITAQDNVLTIEVSPREGDALTDMTYEFVRGIDTAFQLFQPDPSPKEN